MPKPYIATSDSATKQVTHNLLFLISRIKSLSFPTVLLMETLKHLLETLLELTSQDGLPPFDTNKIYYSNNLSLWRWLNNLLLKVLVIFFHNFFADFDWWILLLIGSQPVLLIENFFFCLHFCSSSGQFL